MKQAKSVGRWVGVLSNQIRRRLDSFTAPGSVRGSQGRILHFILAQPGDVFQKDLEEEFKLRPSTATGILQLMEKDGLITRESTPYDARLKRICTTPKADALKAQVIRDVEQLETDFVRGISPDELEIFLKVIRQMSENLST